jgi:riboflavin biosynthesis pyrimidine reductase
VATALVAGLVDEIVVLLAPVLLGGGVRLFGATPRRVRLETTSVSRSGPVTTLRFRVARRDVQAAG